jgi:hypothetical protein
MTLGDLSMIHALLVGDSAKDSQYLRQAQDTTTPPEKLRKLAAYNAAYIVREAVAQNPRTPKDVLEDLAADKSGHVRAAVADNLNTPSTSLTILSQDVDTDVRANCAFNINTPPDVLAWLVLMDNEEEVIKNARANPSTPVEALEVSARESVYVREAYARMIMRDYAAEERADTLAARCADAVSATKANDLSVENPDRATRVEDMR